MRGGHYHEGDIATTCKILLGMVMYWNTGCCIRNGITRTFFSLTYMLNMLSISMMALKENHSQVDYVCSWLYCTYDKTIAEKIDKTLRLLN